MKSHLDPPLVARNGRALQVLVIARISTVHQDERSLDDQVALCRGWMMDHTDHPFEIKSITSRGSGEYLDRKESLEAIDLVTSGDYDLVLTEDLGRIYRRLEAMHFCENCIDCDTRLVAINDHVDTAQENWTVSAFFGVMRHEAYTKDTAARIRRSLRNRFSQGGVVQTLPYGYEKPEGCKDDTQIRKLSEAEEIYDSWFTKLEEGAGFAEIADWLNEKGVPTGRYCRIKHWTSFMVGRITANPILKGVRVRNHKMSKRVNKTGRRRSVNAPIMERLERHCPNLVFLDPDRFDRVNSIVAEKNAKYKRNGSGGITPVRKLLNYHK
jgi:site-specific DNA recombinase